MGIKAKRRRWYSNKLVQYNLVNAMKHREVVFMDIDDYSKCIRGMQISNTQRLNYFFNSFNFFERNYNIYVSVSKYKFIPLFTLNLKKRSDETSLWFSEKANAERFSYDFLFDMDFEKKTDNWLRFISQTQKIINLLNAYKICHYFYPSGTGFQIIVLNPDFNKYNMEKVKNITRLIKDRFNFNFICLGTIGQNTKIRKCEYSLVHDKVCLPLEKLNTYFNYNDVDCNNILKSENLYNRGFKEKNIFSLHDKKYIEKLLRVNLIEA